MNKQDTLKLLTHISDIDGREITSDAVTTWQRTLERYEYAEVEAAFFHVVSTLAGRRLVPSDLISRIKSERDRITFDSADNKNGEPAPICEHNLPLHKCVSCGEDLAARWVCSAHSEIFTRCIPCHSGENPAVTKFLDKPREMVNRRAPGAENIF